MTPLTKSPPKMILRKLLAPILEPKSCIQKLIHWHQKDLNLALTTGREINAALPNTATAQELFTSCASYGLQDSDHSAMVQAIEGMANHQLVPDKAP